MQLQANPMQFLSEAAKRLRAVLERELVLGVKYEPDGGAHPLTLFEEVFETKGDTTETPKRGLYDRIIHDSDPEQNFASDLDSHHAVKVFVKLPKAYKIPTPIGTYNPDFALVIEKPNLDDGDAECRFFFTVETKGTAEWDKLKPEEWLKIQCAVRHFEAIGLKSYLAPVDSLKTFDTRARERTGQTFFE